MLYMETILEALPKFRHADARANSLLSIYGN